MNIPIFWESLDKLLQDHPITIDRPRGTPHPQYRDMIYPLDYGYVVGSTAADGGGIDIWLGSQDNQALIGIVLTFDAAKKDIEVKLLLGCTKQEVATLLEFTGKSMKYLHIPRPGEVG